MTKTFEPVRASENPASEHLYINSLKTEDLQVTTVPTVGELSERLTRLESLVSQVVSQIDIRDKGVKIQASKISVDGKEIRAKVTEGVLFGPELAEKLKKLK